VTMRKEVMNVLKTYLRFARYAVSALSAVGFMNCAST
jgi:hypothetical protein